MSLSRITVLDCGASSVTVGRFRGEAGTLRVESIQTEPLSGAAEENWLTAASAALAVLGEKVRPAGPVVLVLPAHVLLLKHLKTPRVEAAKRAQIVRFEVAQNIPYALDEVVWGTASAGESAQECDLLLAAAKLEVVEPLGAAAAAAGFDVRQVLPSVLALRAAAQLASDGGGARRLLIDVSGRASTFLQLDGARFAVRAVSVAATEAPEAVAAKLAQEATRSMLHFQRQSELAAPVSVGWTDDGRRGSELAALVGARLNLPVTPVALGETVPAALAAAGTSSALANLAGAAALVLLPAGPVMNLLPPAVRRREGLKRRLPWLAVAAVLALSALLPPILHYRREAAAARREAAELEATLAPLRARAARNRVTQEELVAVLRETASLRTLDERRGGWIRLFADLQERFTTVEDVWLENLQTVAPAGEAPLKLSISGRMLDRTNPLAKVSPETVQRVQALLRGLAGSPFVAAVENQRFDSSSPGILKFDFVLVTNPAHPL